MHATPTTDEWVALYLSAEKADRIRAGRMVTYMSKGQVQDVKTELDRQGIEIKGKLLERLQITGGDPVSSNGNGKAETKKIFWGDDEWDFVVSRVSSLSLKEPTASMKSLAERIMKMMPEDQRRSAHAGLISELHKRLAAYNRSHWLHVEQELTTAKSELARRAEAMTREQVIASLTEEEIGQFRQRIIDNMTADDLCSQFPEHVILDCLSQETIIAHAFVRTISSMNRHSTLMEENLTMLARLLAELPQEKMRRQVQEAKNAPARLPQVAFVGFKTDQIAIIADALKGRIRIDVVDKNRSRFDSQAEVIIIWTKFISHSFEKSVVQNMKPGARLIRFSGGLENAAKEISRALKS
jgi:hypothetical protein